MANQRRPEDEERRQSASFALLGFGVLLLMPLFLNLFTWRATLFGLPLEAVYLFAVWLGLVIGAAVLARAAAESASQPQDDARQATAPKLPLPALDATTTAQAPRAAPPTAHAASADRVAR